MHSRVVGFIQRRLKHVRGHGATAGALCLARQGCQPSQLALRPPFLLRRFRLIAAEDLEPVESALEPLADPEAQDRLRAPEAQDRLRAPEATSPRRGA
jgi:hypothetical protein